MTTAQDSSVDFGVFREQLTRDLQAHLALCQEALALTGQENQALTTAVGYDPFAFFSQRKSLLPRLEASLITLRKWRQSWVQIHPAQRAGCPEIQALFQTVQGLLMKVLLLDRENQQALLRRGLLPAGNLPSATAQQPHCVAALYRRHARG
jgi:hypothetical protein